MKVISGRVVGGRIEVDTDLQEGTAVAILALTEAGFQLTPEEEDELATALHDIRSGRFEDGRELLQELKGHRSR